MRMPPCIKGISPVILFTVLSLSAAAQNLVWQSHTDMKSVRECVATEEGIWAVTGGGIFFRTKTGEYSRFTNIDGVTSIDLRAITTDARSRIIAGASDGIILIHSGESGWITVPDISRATDKPRRGINTLVPRGDVIYVGTDFGITVFDPLKREFGDTYSKFGDLPSQTQVNGIHFRGDSIWVATEQGVAVADLRDPNLQDPFKWHSFTAMPSNKVSSITEFEGALVAGLDQGLAILNGNVWEEFGVQNIGRPGVSKLFLHNTGLFVITDKQLYRFSSLYDAGTVGESLFLPGYPSDARFTNITSDIGGTLHVAATVGLSVFRQGEPWLFGKPNGPAANQFLSMTIDESDMLWSASGRDGAGKGLYSFDGSTWINHSLDNRPEFVLNDFTVAAPGVDGEMWFGTWGYGVYLRKPDGNYLRFSPENVPGFPGISTNANFSPISGIKTDIAGNTWILASENGNGNILSCRTRVGDWKFFRNQSLQGMRVVVNSLVIDQYGAKWFIVDDGSFRGLVIFEDNGTLDDLSDDTWQRVNAADANGINAENRIVSVQADNLGDIWVGADVGLRTIFNPRSPESVTRTCYNTRCNIEGQVINCIAIDPVNNKWLGTNAGVYVLSPDGAEIMQQYNTGNSFLLDDEITSISIHPTTGIAFLGTVEGLSAVSTPYAEPGQNFAELKISPNPFYPEIDERIMVDGLAQESTIKILSVSGDLVAELSTPGGRIGFWDGKSDSGEFVPSGIYFVVAYGQEGSETATGKVAVIRK